MIAENAPKETAMEDFKEMFVLFFTGKWKKLFVEPTENRWIGFFRYVFVGGSSFMLDFLIFTLLQRTGMFYMLAELISFVIGFVFNFWGGRKLVFQKGAGGCSETRELVSVLIIALIGLGLTELLLYAGIEWLGLHKLVSKAIAGILVLFYNYFARKLFVYKD